MAYKDLPLKERHAFIRECVANGVHNLRDIEAMYNSSIEQLPEVEVHPQANGGSITSMKQAASSSSKLAAFTSTKLNPSLGHRFGEGGDTTPLDTQEGQTFIQDYAYRASKENPSITAQDVNNATSSVNFTQVDRSSSGIGGTYTADNKTVYLPTLNRWTPSAAHEVGGHHLRNELFGGMSAVSPERQQMLEAAYPNFYVPLEEVQRNRPTEERIATNTQLRAAIMQNTGLSGQALDEYVQNMSDAAILSQLYRLRNGYILGAGLPFTRRSATLSNGQKANIDDYNDLQNLPQGQTSEGWFGMSEEDRQKILKEYEGIFNSNLTDEDKKQAEALRWTLLNVAQNKKPQQPTTHLASQGGSIHISPSKRGTFTAEATKHGKSVQAFASQVLAHKENYSPAMVKKANFARNAAHWHKDGGSEYVPTYFNPIGEYPYSESMSNIIHFINEKTNRKIVRGKDEDKDYEMWEQRRDSEKQIVKEWDEERIQNIYNLSSSKKWKKFVDSYIEEHGKPAYYNINDFLIYAEDNFKDFDKLLYEKFPDDRYRDHEKEYFLNWDDYYGRVNNEVAKRVYPTFEQLLNTKYEQLMDDYKRQVMKPSNAEAFTRSYFESEAYKNRLKKQGLEQEPFPLSSVYLDPTMFIGMSVNGLYGIHVGTKSMDETRKDLVNNGMSEGTANSFIDFDAYPSFVVAHELAHDNPLYNTRGHFNEAPKDSKYYGNDYTNVPQEYKEALIGTGYKDEHDEELSENYSDLVGTRALLFDTGIFDSRDPNAVFNQEMLNNYKKTNEGKSDRFLQYHTDEQIIKAINDVAQASPTKGLPLTGTKYQSSYLASTGGPLYPFSFSKQPLPAVRYANGGVLDWFRSILPQAVDSVELQRPVPQGLDYNKLKVRQAYTESGFDNDAKSSANAIGMFQITPDVLADYNAANNTVYTQDNLYDQDINTAVRDWYMEKLLNRPWVTKGGANDSIQYAKALAAFNYGPTNTLRALNNAKNAGINIYEGWDWLQQLPTETQDYINFILRDQNNSIHRNDTMLEAKKKLRSKEVEKLQ